MNDIADFTPLLTHPRFGEKVQLAQRIIDDAAARRRSVEDAARAKVDGRANRRAYLLQVLDRSRKSPARNVNHAEFEAELTRLDDTEKGFRKEIYDARILADEECQRADACAVAALDWLGEQHADWRAAGQPDGAWLRHVSITPTGKRASVELIREIRADLEEIERQVLDIRGRPSTASELKASIDAALSEVSKRVPLTLDPHQRRSDPFGLMSAMTNHSVQLAHGAVPGAAAVLFALLEPDLRQHFHEQIDAADLTGAMSAEDQDRELTRLATKRLALERQEEAAICSLEAEGLAIARRPDLDPRAFLEVEEL